MVDSVWASIWCKHTIKYLCAAAVKWLLLAVSRYLYGMNTPREGRVVRGKANYSPPPLLSGASRRKQDDLAKMPSTPRKDLCPGMDGIWLGHSCASCARDIPFIHEHKAGICSGMDGISVRQEATDSQISPVRSRQSRSYQTNRPRRSGLAANVSMDGRYLACRHNWPFAAV